MNSDPAIACSCRRTAIEPTDRFDIWDDPSYADLILEGTLGNAIKPWGDRLLGAKVTAVVRNVNEIPCVERSEDPYVSRVITEDWDHDRILERMPMPLPFPVRTDLGAGWSIERTPGLSAGFADGYDRFAGGGRMVAVTAATFLDSGDGALPRRLDGAKMCSAGAVRVEAD